MCQDLMGNIQKGSEMLWGVMAYGWIGGLVGSDDGACERTIELLNSLGLDACQWSIEKLMQLEADKRAEVAARVAASDVHAVLSFHFDYFTDESPRRSDVRTTLKEEELDVQIHRVSLPSYRQIQRKSRRLPAGMCRQGNICAGATAPR